MATDEPTLRESVQRPRQRRPCAKSCMAATWLPTNPRAGPLQSPLRVRTRSTIPQITLPTAELLPEYARKTFLLAFMPHRDSLPLPKCPACTDAADCLTKYRRVDSLFSLILQTGVSFISHLLPLAGVSVSFIR